MPPSVARRQFLKTAGALAWLSALRPTAATIAPKIEFDLQLDVVTSGYDGKTCWAQARAAAIPNPSGPPSVVITMNRLLVSGNDVYLPIHDVRSDDFGHTWSAPQSRADALGRRKEGAVEIGLSDFWPKYHARSGRILGTGQTVRYESDERPDEFGRREVAFSVYDAAKATWSAWAMLDLSGTDMAVHAGAGCVQRYDLPNGEILLPVYYRPAGSRFKEVRVLRCAFDGETIRVLEIGAILGLPSKRGLSEPSLTWFNGRYYLTLRHDDTGYVVTGTDGLNFGALQEWLWEDGTPLGNYNTQTHWVTHHDGLFLVYTRRGANNDHVFRHRAPLFIAEVNSATLRVRRDTERILMPDRGARYGNFGICDVNAAETWVIETEWMQQPGPPKVIPIDNPRGANARVYAARIRWAVPNRALAKGPP